MTDAKLARALVEALEEVAAFSPEDLKGAPLIEDWVVAGGPAPYLMGRVTGHPAIRDGRTVRTSVLIAISVEGGWARTLNRFYLIGRPLGARHVQ